MLRSITSSRLTAIIMINNARSLFMAGRHVLPRNQKKPKDQESVKLRQKTGDDDIRRKIRTTAIAYLLRRVKPTSSHEPANIVPPTNPLPQKTHGETQTTVTPESVTTPPPPVIPSISKEFVYDPLYKNKMMMTSEMIMMMMTIL